MKNSIYQHERELRSESKEHLKWAGINGGIAGLNGFAVLLDALDGQVEAPTVLISGSFAFGLGILAVGRMIRSNQLSNQADAILSGIAAAEAVNS